MLLEVIVYDNMADGCIETYTLAGRTSKTYSFHQQQPPRVITPGKRIMEDTVAVFRESVHDLRRQKSHLKSFEMGPSVGWTFSVITDSTWTHQFPCLSVTTFPQPPPPASSLNV